MRKSLIFLTILFVILLIVVTVNGYAATPLAQPKTFETNILKLDCSGFTVAADASNPPEMSVGTSPNNWTAAAGSQWTSTYSYPVYITTLPHIQKAVRFGSGASTAFVATPTLDLSAVTGKNTKVRIVLTAGTNKTGSLAVKLDGTTIGTINASTSAPGAATFGAFYYIFEYDITATGTASSSLTFQHSNGDGAGYIYVNEINVYREPISLLKLNCQLFSGNSISVISSAAYPNNWTASLGSNPASTAYCFAQNAVANNALYGSGIKIGSSTAGNTGSFTTNNYDISSSLTYKNKFYIELLVPSTSQVGKLDMKVDAGSSQWTYNPATDNGSGGAVAVNTWIPYEGEITGGGSTSNITFYQTRATGTSPIYIRNLRVYREYPGAPTSVVATAGNGKASIAFTAPSVTGGSPITEYTVTSSPGDSTATGASSPLVVSDLANGTAYTFTVIATNSGGSGASSAASNSVTPHATANNIAVSTSTNISTLTLTTVSDVVVANDAELTINQTTTINSLTVAAGGMVTNTSTLNTPSLTLNSNGTDGTGTYINTGTSNVTTLIANQYLGTTRNWYVSSPVVSTASSTSNIAAYYEYIEAGNNTGFATQAVNSSLFWKGYTPGVTFMEAGKGYIALPNAASAAISFSGTMNPDNVSIPLSKTNAGYNLIGNPYPCHLTWTQAFATANSSKIYPTIWVRTNSGSSNANGWSFNTHNALVGETVPVWTNVVIAPMQAFWVKAKVADQTLVLNSDLLKSHQASNPLKAPAVKNTNRQRVRLQVSNGTTTDETLIYFDASASTAFDDYDSPKYPESSTRTQIYTTVGSEKLVINGMRAMLMDTPYNIGFVAGNATAFSIRANELRNIPTGVKVILKDNFTTLETDLTDGVSTYQFSPAVTATDRFSLIFRTAANTTGIENTTKINAQVFVNAANQIIIIAPEKSNYAIYNAVGQKIENGIVNSKLHTINNKLNIGVYFVELIVNGQTEIRKVIIR